VRLLGDAGNPKPEQVTTSTVKKSIAGMAPQCAQKLAPLGAFSTFRGRLHPGFEQDALRRVAADLVHEFE
jgi:hypothetical protein